MIWRHFLPLLLLILATPTRLVGGEEFDTTELVVEGDFNTKKNKEITGFSQEEKDNLVNIHNAYRSLVRPYGADMIELTWDDDIAAFAQDWADQCTATHRTNRDLDPWVNMGENLYWWYSGKYHEGMAVKYWWDEVQYYTLSSMGCTAEEVCGHYITMVWGKTEKIGCGVARCDRLLDHPDYGRGAYYFVCNYSGRFVSDIKPYTATDTPCSACYLTEDYPKCRYNLCVTNDMLLSGEGYDGSTDMVGLYRSLNVTSEHEPTSTTQEPVSSTTEEPTTTAAGSSSTQAPITSTEEATTSSPVPTTTTPEPTTTTPEPTTTTPEPTTTTPEATTTTPEPTTTTPEPTTTTPEPTTTSPEATTTTPETTTTTPEATTTTPEETTTTPEETTTTTESISTTTIQMTTDETWDSLNKINTYCLSRHKDYVRNVCWRLNNMLRRFLGYPEANGIVKREAPDNEFELEGGSLGVTVSTTTTTSTASTSTPSDYLTLAFHDIDLYCSGRDSKYKRRVCRKLKKNMRSILEVTYQTGVTEERR